MRRLKLQYRMCCGLVASQVFESVPSTEVNSEGAGKPPRRLSVAAFDLPAGYPRLGLLSASARMGLRGDPNMGRQKWILLMRPATRGSCFIQSSTNTCRFQRKAWKKAQETVSNNLTRKVKAEDPGDGVRVQYKGAITCQKQILT